MSKFINIPFLISNCFLVILIPKKIPIKLKIIFKVSNQSGSMITNSTDE